VKWNTKPCAFLCGALILITIAVYLPVLRNGFIWDDDAYVTANPLLRSPGGLERIWTQPTATPQYYPLAFTSFWIEYHLWHLQPFGYHLVNVLLHAFNAVLLWAILRELEVPGSWLIAAVFGVHPVAVESVAWVTERKNVLSTCFYMLTLLAFLRFRPLTGGQIEDRPPDWQRYQIVVVLFICALLSKTVTCTLPVVLGLLIWWKVGRLRKWDIVTLTPLLVLGAVLGFITAWMEKHHVGANGAEWSLSLVQRCLLAGRALWFYAGTLCWPQNLVFNYPRWQIDARAIWQYIFPLTALSVLVALSLVKSRVGKGPLVAVLYFAVTLVPALGFVDVYPFRYSYVADHFQYLACIGLISLAVAGGTIVYQKAGHWGQVVGRLTAVVILLVLGATTWGQTYMFKDSETLWRETLLRNPRSFLAHNNLGMIFKERKQYGPATEHFRKAVELWPDYLEAHTNLGFTLTVMGKDGEALEELREVVRLKPTSAEGHNNLGVALAMKGSTEEAILHFTEASRIRPSFTDAAYNLQLALDLEKNPRKSLGVHIEAR
jgi:tetratricopeptide (TPR) repeat protein